ncbi:hypothetical protein CLAFUW4_13288 [Fulvia fulva]|uniref:Uncharacterized protein n=1 Tax=Passalora fulva TaxID=5499 RepID=A0A9Q8PKG8_PASFU|nr:uncharacterized protein CLAFUR5_13143 [Fulvia fulva]KAK4612260.1 hypothetical protein CLAFUR4_13293 [Fulvia fulva]KAK4613063.1 hypothetical protein CLAFUR0_13298 [Fulvia fulva]UJO24034.1 hypothetical protein CLAFUR5_13143 [Fulvia fulva]WPV21401.1 hypothetical protein CLAFUW4_13288 [Fulvia fulva]WPV36560.1 hypothetical protein CLAFUW7_13295 [Fulvia fulva]
MSSTALIQFTNSPIDDPQAKFLQKCQTLHNKANALLKLMDALDHTEHRKNLAGAIKHVEYVIESTYVADNGVARGEENLAILHFFMRQDLLEQVKREMREKRGLIEELGLEIFGVEGDGGE